MLREKEKLINEFSVISDIIIALLNFAIFYSIFKKTLNPQVFQQHLILGLLLLPTAYILFRITDVSKIRRTSSYAQIFIEYLFVNFLLLGFLFLYIFIFKLHTTGRLMMFCFGVSNFFSTYILRISFFHLLKYFRKKGFNTRNLLIIADSDSDSIIEKIRDLSYLDFVIKVIVTDSEKITGLYQEKFAVLPTTIDISRFLELESIDEVLFCRNIYSQEELKQLIYICQEIGVVFRMQANNLLSLMSKAKMISLEEISFLTFSNTPNDYFALKMKSFFDYSASFLILFFSLPFFLFIAILIKTTSKGPVFFKQIRVGLRGRKFLVYKFRTMVRDAEKLKNELLSQNEQQGPVFKMKNDPRITKIGKFLRKTSLDEFPQFINVLRGEMSIVGPRPPIPEEVAKYERWQLRRLSMKPGITCIWQVSGRNNISFEDWMRLDLLYIDTWSLKLDFILFIKTIKVIFRATGQ